MTILQLTCSATLMVSIIWNLLKVLFHLKGEPVLNVIAHLDGVNE